MSSKRKNIIQIDFSNGEAAQHVTGSCIYIKAKEFNIILECGLTQSNNLKKDYLINKENFNFKPSKIDYVFCMHLHADHSSRIPLLYRRGCQAPLILPKNSKEIYLDMQLDSNHIMERDSEYLGRVLGRNVEPLYTEEDVYKSYSKIKEYPMNELIKLNDNISFKFINSGHIISSAQIELWLTSGNTTKKIIYTSDLGNDLIDKYYVNSFEPFEKADLVIGESTYGDSKRSIANKALRKKDLEKLKSIIEYQCLERRQKILIPVFALDRLPEILTEIYMLYKDSDFNIPVVIDTPLGIKHIKNYFHILKGQQLELLDEVMKWKNIIQVQSYTETLGWARTPRPCIILASSGMLTAGRSITYAENMVDDFNAHIIFCGYSTENSIGWKIKHPKDFKYIEINGNKLHNRCGVTDLHSFSSHMQYPSLIKYYTNINCTQLALVHGEMNSKIKFAAALKEEYTKKNKSTRVICVNKSMKINL